MTTIHHDEHAFGAPLSSAEINRALGELDAALDLAITSGSGWSSVLDATAASGQKVVPVQDTTGALPGQAVYIGAPTGTNEQRVIDTVQAGVSVTVTVNLTNTYAAGTLISASPAEIVAARDGFASLAARLDAHIGDLVDKGTGSFGVVDATTKRIPVNFGMEMVGPDIVADPAASNVIAYQISPRFTGSIAGIGGLDPGFVWGVSIFTTDGPAAGDGDGIVDLTGFVSEIAIQSSAADQGVIRAGHFSTALWGDLSGGHIDQIEGLRVGAPVLKDGADAIDWTIDASYLLFVEDPGTLGTNRFAIFTAGGPSRFTGRLDVLGDIVITGKFTIGSTSFPGGPAVNDVHYRIDRKMWFQWDGTRWLCTCPHTDALGWIDNSSANATSIYRLPGDPLDAAGISVEAFEVYFKIATGGTALGASHAWDVHLRSYVGNTGTARAAPSINSGASDVWRVISQSGIGTFDGIDMWEIQIFKTGTPGNFSGGCRMRYRLVG